MHIINMISDFRVLAEECKKIGKWEAFKNYHDKYPEVWEKMLGYLYMVNLEGLEPMVETIDFDSLLVQVEENIHKVEEVEELARAAASKLEFDEVFEVYVGVGLGHVNVVTLQGDKPAIYVGVECIGDSALDYLIPHAINHMIRNWKVKEINPNAFKERVITEGIGTLYPIIFNEEKMVGETFAKALLMPKESVEILLDKEVECTRRVFEKMEFTLTPQLMKEFFNYNPESQEPQLLGYFVGMRIVQRLMEKGRTIQQLTVMSADEIITKYQETL